VQNINDPLKLFAGMCGKVGEDEMTITELALSGTHHNRMSLQRFIDMSVIFSAVGSDDSTRPGGLLRNRRRNQWMIAEQVIEDRSLVFSFLSYGMDSPRQHIAEYAV